MQRSKKLISSLMALVLVFGLCFTTANAKDTPLTLDNASAAVTGATYDADNGYVINLATGATVTYTVGEHSNGVFDVYLEVSKQTMGYGTTPFSISVNGGQASVPIIEYQWCLADKSDLYAKGIFLCLEHVKLKTGDTITVTALPGFGFSTTSFAPYVGDVLLYRPGEKVAVGYGGETPDKGHNEKSHYPADALAGRRLIWLGSSVAFGQMAKGYSVADYLEESHQRLVSYKYCVSGTTMVDSGPSSFISRMKQIPTDIRPDAFVVQLSTNDAAGNKPFGALSTSKNISDFDTSTIYGAMEYIIAYASETWHCPVIFFTGTFYDKNTYYNDGVAYGKTVTALFEVQHKWGIDIIDLYNDADMTALYNTDLWKQYMSDGVHPKADGYKLWWGPKFEQALTSFFEDNGNHHGHGGNNGHP
jgi:lysophospholipase L1-like esterase